MTFFHVSEPVRQTPAIVRVGRFRILHELGRGTVGSVYLGHDPVIDRSVAIKTFNPRLTSAEKKQYEQQFINEARAAGRLSHPNIVTIFDASSEGGTTYIAMEYLEGRELSKVLDSGTRFLPDEVAAIICKVADALDYAHKHGVVHRDIKPANIFILRNNHPKVVDFGIARAPNRIPDQGAPDNEPYTMYRSNLLGTPNYMSPEQATGRPVDLRTDIYSLGAVMYEMLCGCKPFKAKDTQQLLQMIAHKAPTPLTSIDPHIPETLAAIAMKAMSKKEEKRYQHAEEMVHDLKRYLQMEKRSRRLARKEASMAAANEATLPASRKVRPVFWTGFLVSLAVLALFALSALY